MSPERRQFRSTAVLKNNYHGEGYCVCCLKYKGKEEKGRELKVHRLTADKKLRKVRWSPLIETGQKGFTVHAFSLSTCFHCPAANCHCPAANCHCPAANCHCPAAVTVQRLTPRNVHPVRCTPSAHFPLDLLPETDQSAPSAGTPLRRSTLVSVWNLASVQLVKPVSSQLSS